MVASRRNNGKVLTSFGNHPHKQNLYHRSWKPCIVRTKMYTLCAIHIFCLNFPSLHVIPWTNTVNKINTKYTRVISAILGHFLDNYIWRQPNCHNRTSQQQEVSQNIVQIRWSAWVIITLLYNQLSKQWVCLTRSLPATAVFKDTRPCPQHCKTAVTAKCQPALLAIQLQFCLSSFSVYILLALWKYIVIFPIHIINFWQKKE